MRIGMMTDAYKPHVSGITNVIDLSKRFLEKQGHEVYVFTFVEKIIKMMKRIFSVPVESL